MGDELVGSPPDTVEVLVEQCGYHLALGMSPGEYWDGDPELARYYRAAARVRQEQENYSLWLQGYYFYAALERVAPLYHLMSNHPKAHPYLTEPVPLGRKDSGRRKEKREEEAMRQSVSFMEQWAIAFNEQFAKKGGGVNGD